MRGIVFAMAVLGAQPANADWQWTKWGQTQDEILSRTDMGVRLPTAQEIKDNTNYIPASPGAVAPYNTPDAKMLAVFLFERGRLAGVRLTIRNPTDGNTLLAKLKAQYGEPTNGHNEMNPRAPACREIKHTWKDTARQNTVSFSSLSCGQIADTPPLYIGGIIYQPILSASDTGL